MTDSGFRENEIKEIRKLIINNLNTVHSLEASIKAIDKNIKEKESDGGKVFLLAALLGVVIILAFFFYFKAEVNSRAERINLMAKHEEYMKKEIESLKEKLFTVENNDIKAYNLYIAFKEGEPDQAIKMYRSFDLSALSRLERLVIDSEMNLIRQKAAVKKFEEGDTLFKRKSYDAAVAKFNESLKISSTGEHVPTLFYKTALSQYRMKQYDKAAITFDRFLFLNSEKGFMKDKSELLLGVCYEKMKQYDRAINFYNRVLIENPRSNFRPTIKDRMKILRRKLSRQQLEDQS